MSKPTCLPYIATVFLVWICFLCDFLDAAPFQTLRARSASAVHGEQVTVNFCATWEGAEFMCEKIFGTWCTYCTNSDAPHEADMNICVTKTGVKRAKEGTLLSLIYLSQCRLVALLCNSAASLGVV
jgi:hypothetical protein